MSALAFRIPSHIFILSQLFYKKALEMSFPSINSSAILGNPRVSVGLPSLVFANVGNKFGITK
jgi:hypothetical protein